MKTSKIISKIIEGKLNNAFDSFDEIFENINELRRQILVVRSQYNELMQKGAMGTINEENIRVEKSKTIKKLLDYIAMLETTLVADVEKEKVKESNSKSEELRKIANEMLEDKDYQIVHKIHSELSSIFYKAKKISVHINDYYVVQILNQYQIGDNETPFDKTLLEFFSNCKDPFVEIQEFVPTNPCYIIRDYVNGIDLNNLVENNIKLSLLDTINAAITIGEALQELHRSKITYKNFIPSQIIMDIDGDVKVLPMNIFKTSREVVTWKQLKNSVKYMSPEELIQSGDRTLSVKMDPQSNQYSLGLIIYYMIQGLSIFEGKGLASLYEDRIDNRETIGELRDFIDTIHQKLSYYSIPKETADTMGSVFIETYNRLLKFNPAERFGEIEDFVFEMQVLKNQLKKVRRDFSDDDLLTVQESFENAVFNNKETIEDFYTKLLENITLRDSFEKADRNIIFYYSMKYLFNSISSLDNEQGLKEAVTCLIQSLHSDVDIIDFETFFEILKKVIETNNPEDWNEQVSLSWDRFNQKVLDTIDGMLFTKQA